MYIRVELVLTLDQLWMLYPNATVLNVDDETLVICNVDTISADSVIDISNPPTHLLRLDCTYSVPIVQPLNFKVHYFFVKIILMPCF